MSPVPEIASSTNVTKHRFFFFLQNYTHFSNTGKQIDLCVLWSVAASNQLLSPCYHLNQEINQFMILFIVLGLLLDMTDWDIYRNMTLPVLYDKHLFIDFLTHYKQKTGGELSCFRGPHARRIVEKKVPFVVIYAITEWNSSLGKWCNTAHEIK
jgi:hypothetical protein